MHFILKSIFQNFISYLPKGENLNYILQKRFTKTLPRNKKSFLEKIKIANKHFNYFKSYCPNIEISKAIFFEFGAGQDLIIPIVYFCFGIKHQEIVDIRKLMRFELVNNTISRLANIRKEDEQIFNRPFSIDIIEIKSIADLFDIFGIRWVAPIDAKRTKFPQETFDFISNTATFEHIPAGDIEIIFKECNRIMKTGGIMSCCIDMKDHYSYFDSKISHYNFLKYNDITWQLLNAPLQFQNRLRYPDYIDLIKKSGFEIVKEEVEKAGNDDIEILKNLRLASKFRDKYSLEDLGAKTLWVVLKK